jgi:hypothetical protein
VRPSGGDPIYLADVSSPKVYRAALEREFIKRRPGQYSQALLSDRLGVCPLTLRTYHRHIPIRSRKCYIPLPLTWQNVERVPLGKENDELGLSGGRFLVDETGKRWPPKREIAQKLLKQGKRVEYWIQGVNFYWYGDSEPALPSQMKRYYPQSVQQKSPKPVKNRQPMAQSREGLPHNATLGSKVAEKPASTPTQPPCEVVYVNPVPPRQAAPLVMPAPHPPRPKGYYRRPLEDGSAEYWATRLASEIAEMSLSTARQLVDKFGIEAVQPTFYKMGRLCQKEKVRNPAGFMITAVRVKWKVLHNHQPGEYYPEFKPERHRRRKRASSNRTADVQPNSPLLC